MDESLKPRHWSNERHKQDISQNVFSNCAIPIPFWSCKMSESWVIGFIDMKHIATSVSVHYPSYADCWGHVSAALILSNCIVHISVQEDFHRNGRLWKLQNECSKSPAQYSRIPANEKDNKRIYNHIILWEIRSFSPLVYDTSHKEATGSITNIPYSFFTHGKTGKVGHVEGNKIPCSTVHIHDLSNSIRNPLHFSFLLSLCLSWSGP